MEIHTSWSQKDRKELERLFAVRAQNERILSLYSDYLNRTPRFLTAQMVEDLAHECGISVENAFRTYFAAACGLDTERPEDRRLERLYIMPGVRLMRAEDYRRDRYFSAIRFPEKIAGKWCFREEFYAPYEPFVCGHPILTEEFREIPRIGFFDKEFRFPAVLENDVEWMTVTPNEMETMREPIAQANGHVLTFGLGLGYFAFHVSEKENVRQVTVVERDGELIDLFRNYLLPQFSHSGKIRIVQADAFDYAQREFPTGKFDFIFTDLWHDQSDGLELYLRMRKLERLSPTSLFSYWIEPTLLSALRSALLERIFDVRNPSMIQASSFAALAALLKDDGLRKIISDRK